MNVNIQSQKKSYDISVKRGSLAHARDYLNLERRVLIVTDYGVPMKYAATVASQCSFAKIVTVPNGEGSKSFDYLSRILTVMLSQNFTRTDAVVAVGGGVVGDLAGFAASIYMRGVDFYNVPTTLLSMVDSSIGGKTAINHEGVKNSIGTFYQPKHVLIDPDVLSSLPRRQLACGLAEAIKMAATSDADFFRRIEGVSLGEDIGRETIDDIINSSLYIKKCVVEADETEHGQRRVLNFGHTVGHGIESAAHGTLFHGECVALGMLLMCEGEAQARIKSLLKSAGLPTYCDIDIDKIISFVTHDKKIEGNTINYVTVPQIGSYRFERVGVDVFTRDMKSRWEEIMA
ncbi:MAG: 3-dehydroquinate synthase [Firmicutes bacterium]|nr:3-dehydroquinate synthase [Bacillota bacterium]